MGGPPGHGRTGTEGGFTMRPIGNQAIIDITQKEDRMISILRITRRGRWPAEALGEKEMAFIRSGGIERALEYWGKEDNALTDVDGDEGGERVSTGSSCGDEARVILDVRDWGPVGRPDTG